MENQSDYATRQRGGITVRDYTQSGLPEALKRRLPGMASPVLMRTPEHRDTREAITGGRLVNFDQMGRGMIFTSLGLGLVELLMPRRFLRLIGVRQRGFSGLVRLLGLRELASAALLFSQSRPHTGMWSRVIGDVMDLGLLLGAFATRRADAGRLAAATAVVTGATVMDVVTAKGISRVKEAARQVSDFTQDDLDTRTSDRAFRVTRSITINRPADELYRYWHNFENLPNFMLHLERVSVIDEVRSHWVAKAPAGTLVEWDAEIIDDQPNSLIAWSAIPGSQVMNAGQVQFIPAPRDQGTVVRVQLDYHPPAGRLGKIAAQLFGEEPGQQVEGDLHRFKQVIETGEVLVSDGAIVGRGQKVPRPARPPEGEARLRKDKGATKWNDEARRVRDEDVIRSNMRE